MTESTLRRVTAAALVVAPALLLATTCCIRRSSRAATRRSSWPRSQTHYQRWQAAHAIGFVSAILILAVAIAGLAALVATAGAPARAWWGARSGSRD